MTERLESLKSAVRKFSKARDWDQFHSPKNLACALSVEAAELLEHFQWLPEEQSRSMPLRERREIGEEIADVFLYLLQLSDKLDIDLVNCAARKLRLNAKKYPVSKSRGKSVKYTKL